MSLLSFAGFFRFSEVVNIRRSNIKFKDGFMSIFVENSKTDVYRDGRHVLIAATGSDLCPVNMLNRYLIAGNVAETSNEYIFRQLSFCKSVQKYVLKGQKPLSYTRAREIFIEKFKLIGEDVKKVGLHSFRSGGATAAANAGVTDRLFKRHGRWASDKAKDGDIKDNVSELLSVSSMLGL
ncbi:integrase/recombinase xerD homolog [Haliotis cracherodii]|uniref:integrase/recombinase xerD homolog n=1 Tax=Haliotis cracherodii TaxID=6455 RepID=UPI0039EC546C